MKRDLSKGQVVTLIACHCQKDGNHWIGPRNVSEPSFLRAFYGHRFHAVFVFLAVTFFALSVRSQIHAYPDRESANILSIIQNKPDPSIKIEPVTGSKKSSLVTNPARTFRAYELCVPTSKQASECDYRVYFTEISTGTTYMVSGEEKELESARPIDALKWLDNNRLSYERWEGPHFGHRYTIDVKLKKQVAAYELSDQPK